LVQALTGVDADTLPEEKQRGMTIELGFVFLEDAGLDRQIVFIDVPGHERFIKTMVAGAGHVDAALLVVAADEGVSPQTREHLDLLELLGTPRGLVVLTKADLADETRRAQVRAEVVALVAGTFLEGAPILAVSAVTGEGLPALREGLAQIAGQATPRPDNGVFRMPVDRVFTRHGFGAVIAGTVLSGRVRVGDRVEILPEGLVARVRGVQVHREQVEESCAGLRTALNLQGVEQEALRRGQTAGAPGAGWATRRLDVRLRLLARRREPLKNRTRLRVHLGTDEVICRVALLDREELEPGASGLAQLLLEAPLVALPGDRFAVRLFSPLETVGGGVVLDALPAAHKRRDPAVLESLSRLEGAGEEVVEEFFRLAGAAAPASAQVARRAGKAAEEVAALATGLAQSERLVVVPGTEGPRYLAHEVALALGERMLEAVAAFFRENPYRLYMPVADLTARLRGEADPVVVGFILEERERAGRVKRLGKRLALPDRRVQLPAGERELLERIERAFREGGLAPPAEEEVQEQLGVKAPVWERLIGLLLEGERLVRVAERVTYHRDAYDTVRRTVQEALAESGGITVAQLRDRLGVSRKYSLALLEHFDNVHLTRRDGERHVGGN
jgi:selenocysteine-specific elongation factor